MQAQDIMTKELITVAPDTPISEIAKLLVQHRIGAVPVLAADGRLLGLVSQTDLGHRSETGTGKRRKWWLDMFADPDAQAREYVKTHGLKAEDVMTSESCPSSKSRNGSPTTWSTGQGTWPLLSSWRVSPRGRRSRESTSLPPRTCG